MTRPSAAGSDSATGTRHLHRAVGFWGLMFISLGSIIGSGWLLGALTTAVIAGPASLISWVLASTMLAVLALAHAELGATYPIAGGTARFPFFAFGPLVGFTAGWMSWLRSVLISPIEVEATLSYMDRIGWVHDRVHVLHPNGTLTAAGLLIASVFMLIFTLINVLGVRLLSGINSVTAVVKTAVPLLTVVVLMALSFHGSNFTAGGGFAPHGAHGVFAALPAGVVFALLGFEQAIQLAGEARDPQRDVSRAVIVAMAVGTALYLLLQIAFIAALNPDAVTHSWDNPVGKGNFGPYATLATFVGAAGWRPSSTSTPSSPRRAPAWSTWPAPRVSPTPWDANGSCPKPSPRSAAAGYPSSRSSSPSWSARSRSCRFPAGRRW